MQYFAAQAESCGLNHSYDSIGNLVIETPGSFNHWVETGSHVDTVPRGGNYDGLAGVVAGLAALQAMVNSNISLHHGLRLRIWRGEESASFGITSIGSRAAFSQLPPSSLAMRCRGKSLRDSMADQHADPTAIENSIPSISANEKEHIAAYIELHIEQGKVLETEQFDIGIVTAIRGSRRSWVTLNGTFDHSGATPMGREYRHDCNLAMAYIHVRLDELIQKQNRNGTDMVQTIGIINSQSERSEKLAIDQNSVSKVSGIAYFSHEVRGCESTEVSTYCDQAESLMLQTAADFGVTAMIETFSDQAGIPALDSQIQQQLAEHCKALGYTHMKLASGAWHDAGTVAQQTRSDGTHIPVGMIFIPCRDGISHSPLEQTSNEQIAKGASLLATSMIHLAVKDLHCLGKQKEKA